GARGGGRGGRGAGGPGARRNAARGGTRATTTSPGGPTSTISTPVVRPRPRRSCVTERLPVFNAPLTSAGAALRAGTRPDKSTVPIVTPASTARTRAFIARPP